MEEMGSSQKCLYYWENFEHVICKRELFLKKQKRNIVQFAVGRKSSIERLTDLWCDELKQHRNIRNHKNIYIPPPLSLIKGL